MSKRTFSLVPTLKLPVSNPLALLINRSLNAPLLGVPNPRPVTSLAILLLPPLVGLRSAAIAPSSSPRPKPSDALRALASSEGPLSVKDWACCSCARRVASSASLRARAASAWSGRRSVVVLTRHRTHQH